MTLAEVLRYEEGAHWRMQQKAQFDYTLANLIGISSARMISNEVTYPSLEEAYPVLFAKTQQEKDEENKRRQEEELATQNSVNRFMEFALKHNAMMRKEEGDKT